MAAQLYETTSGRLFHAGAVAVITVGYGKTALHSLYVLRSIIYTSFFNLVYLPVVKLMPRDLYVATCVGWVFQPKYSVSVTTEEND